MDTASSAVRGPLIGAGVVALCLVAGVAWYFSAEEEAGSTADTARATPVTEVAEAADPAPEEVAAADASKRVVPSHRNLWLLYHQKSPSPTPSPLEEF